MPQTPRMARWVNPLHQQVISSHLNMEHSNVCSLEIHLISGVNIHLLPFPTSKFNARAFFAYWIFIYVLPVGDIKKHIHVVFISYLIVSMQCTMCFF